MGEGESPLVCKHRERERQDGAARNSACPHAPMRFRSRRLSINPSIDTSDSREFIIGARETLPNAPRTIADLDTGDWRRSVHSRSSKKINLMSLEKFEMYGSLYLESSES